MEHEINAMQERGGAIVNGADGVRRGRFHVQRRAIAVRLRRVSARAARACRARARPA